MDDLIYLLEQQKRALYGECESIDEAYWYARDLLTMAHKHDITEALDIYHNTLVSNVINIIKDSQPKQAIAAVHYK